jgi:hypothetical protein
MQWKLLPKPVRSSSNKWRDLCFSYSDALKNPVLSTAFNAMSQLNIDKIALNQLLSATFNATNSKCPALAAAIGP